MHRRPAVDDPTVTLAVSEAISCAIRDMSDGVAIRSIQESAARDVEVLAHAWQECLSSEVVDRHTINRAADLLVQARRQIERNRS